MSGPEFKFLRKRAEWEKMPALARPNNLLARYYLAEKLGLPRAPLENS